MSNLKSAEEIPNSNLIDNRVCMNNSTSKTSSVTSSHAPGVSIEKQLTQNCLLSKKIKRSIKAVPNKDICTICRDGGDLILCDQCPKSFHWHCLKLKSSDIPEGNWYCPICKAKKDRNKANGKLDNGALDNEAIQRKLIKNEKRRLWRFRHKEQWNALRLKKKHMSHSENQSETKGESNSKVDDSGYKNKLTSNWIDSFWWPTNQAVKNIKYQRDNSNWSFNWTYTPILDNSIVNSNNKENTDINTTKTISIPILYPLTETHIGWVRKNMDIITSKINSMPLLNTIINNPISTISSSSYEQWTEQERSKEMTEALEAIYKTPNSINELNQWSRTNIKWYSDIVKDYYITLNAKKNSKHQIKYPINDEELYSFPDVHNWDAWYFSKPNGKEIKLIPQQYFGDWIQWFDFFQTFSVSALSWSEFTLEEWFAAFYYPSTTEWKEIFGINFVNNLVDEVHVSLWNILFTKLMSLQYTDLQNSSDDELILIKIIYDNLGKKEFDVFLYETWPEILRIFITSTSFKSQLISSSLVSGLKSINKSTYNTLLNYDMKIQLWKYLICSCYDTECIRGIIKDEQTKRNEIRKTKKDFEEEYRETDQRKKKLEREEKFTQPQLKVEQLNKQLSTLSEDHMELSRKQLSKLRKEIEYERDQFKSDLKEMDILENRKNEWRNKIDKIQTEIYEIPTMNKKFLGCDYRGYKYFYMPWDKNKIYIKLKSKDSSIKYEWHELSTEDDIKDLLSKLTEKGEKEWSLKSKIKKILQKRMLHSSKIINDEIEDTISTVFNNKSMKYVNKLSVIDQDNRTENTLSKHMLSLESKITSYLAIDSKQWESFDNRQNAIAWMSNDEDIGRYRNLLWFFNEKLKNPYKICAGTHQSSGNMVTDDDAFFSFIGNDGNLDPYQTNPKLVLANKTKIYSKEFETWAVEDIYLEYLNTATSLNQIEVAIMVFDALCIDLSKRRDYYKRKNEEMLNNEIKGLGLQVNSNEEWKQQSEAVDIEDKFDDDCFSENNTYKRRWRKDKNHKIDYNENSGAKKKEKQNKNYMSHNTDNKADLQNKKIDWNDNCMFCQDVGDLICCEECPNVAHFSCIGCKKEPEAWTCTDCMYKYANKRTTRTNRANINYREY